MIIFELILTTFKLSMVFRGIWVSSENWLELKIEPPSANLAFPSPRNALYVVNQASQRNLQEYRNGRQKRLRLSLEVVGAVLPSG